MPQIVIINGRLVPPSEAVISVFDRGFLYGDSVFETLRTYGGVPFRSALHWQRLRASAERVFIELPVTPDTIDQEVRVAVLAAQNSESYVRVVVTRGTGDTLGLDPALANQPTRVVLVGPLMAPAAAAYAEGVSVISYRTSRVSDDTEASGAKVGNYLVAVLAMREAKKHGALEALIVDGGGRVLEGATSNIFMVTGGSLLTPPLELGILPGITRRTVLELAQHLGIPCEERALRLTDLLQADEVFITSSIREILPVVRIDGNPIKTGHPGSITQKLLGEFRRFALESNC